MFFFSSPILTLSIPENTYQLIPTSALVARPAAQYRDGRVGWLWDAGRAARGAPSNAERGKLRGGKRKTLCVYVCVCVCLNGIRCVPELLLYFTCTMEGDWETRRLVVLTWRHVGSQGSTWMVGPKSGELFFCHGRGECFCLTFTWDAESIRVFPFDEYPRVRVEKQLYK